MFTFLATDNICYFMSSDLCVTQCGDNPNKHIPPHKVCGGGGGRKLCCGQITWYLCYVIISGLASNSK